MSRLSVLTFSFLLLQSSFAQMTAGPIAPYQPSYAELKSALNLTDDQVNQLKGIQQSKIQSSQAVFQQISQKQRQLNDMLSGGSTDAAAIGNLTIEIQHLRTQATAQPSSRDAALAILTADQKAKLAKLSEALSLRQAVDQAVGLNLLEYPHATQPIGPMMPMGMGAVPPPIRK